MKYIIILIFGGILLSNCRNAPIELFSLKEVQTSAGVTLLDIDEKQLHNLRIDNAENVEIVVPFGGKNTVFQLTQQELFTPDFKVMTDKGQEPYIPGIYYSGKVKDDPKSIVNISILNDEVTGVIITAYQTINLGKANDVYVLSDPLFLAEKFDFTCHTPEEGINAEEIRMLTEKQVSTNAVNNCVSVDLEMSYSDYQQFGSTTAVTNWITTIFSSVKTLYKNDGIEISIKSIYIWTTPDGYSAEPATALNQVRAKRLGDPNFTGSTTLFVRGKTSGFSGIAYLGVNCLDQYNAAVADVQFGASVYPTYSWTVEVTAHELSHNFGSHHTQWCGWEGGAIDNCYTTEGGCPPGPAPIGGGTIESYCHLTSYGINFTKGWGPQPSKAMRDHIASSTCSPCTTTPPPSPTCTDGILNNGETSIDCGGPNCPSCPPPPATPISQGKPATQSTTYSSFSAGRTVDGNTLTFNHTQNELQPFLQIDLQQNYKLSSIELFNRADCCGERLKNFKIYVSSDVVFSAEEICYTNTTTIATNQKLVIPVTKTGRYVKLIAENAVATPLHIGEFKIFGTPSTTPPCTPRDTVYKVIRDSIGTICR